MFYVRVCYTVCMNFSDDYMLFSFINTKLRDEYASLDDLCEDLEFSREEVEGRLGVLGYKYDEKQNRFV